MGHGVARAPRRTACWPAGWPPPRRSPRSTPRCWSTWLADDGGRVKAGEAVGAVERPAGRHPHRRAHRPQPPLAPVGHRHPHPPLRRGRRRPGRHPRHPQDHARPAGPGEGGGAGRGRHQPPGQPVRRHPGQGQPPGRAVDRRRRRPRPARCGRGAASQVECDTLDQVTGARRRRRPRAARQHDARRGARVRAQDRRRPVRWSRCPAASPSTPSPPTPPPAPTSSRSAPSPTRPRSSTSASTSDPDASAAPCCSASTPATPTPSSACTSGERAGRPLAHRHQRRADVRRARPADHQFLVQPRLVVRRRRHRRGGVLDASPGSRPCCGRWPTRYLRFAPVVLEPGIRTGMPILYENPRQVGPDRIANAVGAFDLLRRADDRGRLRHRHHRRRHLGHGRVPGRRHPPRHRDQPRRPVRPGRGPVVGSSWSKPRRVIGKSTPSRSSRACSTGIAAAVDGLCPLPGGAGRRARWCPPAGWPS